MEPAAFNRGLIALLTGLFLITVAWPVSGTAEQSAEGGELTRALRANVVAIRATWADGSQHDGFGFMVGVRGNETYIATADHVVRDNSPSSMPDRVAQKIEIETFERRGRTFEAVLLGTHEASIDLAVITAELPSDISWRKDALASEPDELTYGAEVWFVGRDKRWYVPGRPGVINRIDRLRHKIIVDDLSVRAGTSGAILVAEDGIVGMIVRDDAAESRATLIDVIETAFRDWGHPWDLLPIVERRPEALVEESLETPAEAEAEAGLPLTRAERREVQRALQALGYNPRGIDGIFGDNTRRALETWQNELGAKATGFLTEGQYTKLLAEARPKLAAMPEPRTKPPRALLIAKAEEEVRAIFNAVTQRDVNAIIRRVEVPYSDRGEILTNKSEIRNALLARMEKPSYPKYFTIIEVDAEFVSDYKKRDGGAEAHNIARALQLEDNDVMAQVHYTFETVDRAQAVLFFRLDEGDLRYAGACCLQTQAKPGTTAPSEPAQEMDVSKIFQIPTANITIDGDFRDWRRVRPVLVDPPNDEDSKANFSGTDMDTFYLARDSQYLYLAMTLHDGLPQWDLSTLYFFVANQRPFEVDIPGDMDAAVSFYEGNRNVWTNERGIGGRPVREATDYPSHFVASGPSFIEWKVPLNDMGDLNGRFVRVYIHVVEPEFQRVSDGNLPGIELRVD